jgi:hypothetical protein
MSYAEFQINERWCVKADKYQWMLCRWRGRWVPQYFYFDLQSVLKRVLDCELKEADGNDVHEVLDAITRLEQATLGAIEKIGITRKITAESE